MEPFPWLVQRISSAMRICNGVYSRCNVTTPQYFSKSWFMSHTYSSLSAITCINHSFLWALAISSSRQRSFFPIRPATAVQRQETLATLPNSERPNAVRNGRVPWTWSTASNPLLRKGRRGWQPTVYHILTTIDSGWYGCDFLRLPIRNDLARTKVVALAMDL